MATLLLGAPAISSANDSSKKNCATWFQDLRNFTREVFRRKPPEPLEPESIYSPGLAGSQPPLVSKETRATEVFDLKTAVKNKQVRQFVFSELTDAQELDRFKEAPGLGYLKAFQAQHEGQSVFVKVSRVKKGDGSIPFRTFEHFENEVAWSRRLEALGIGPKLHGVSDFNGHYTIVTEYIDGVHLDGLRSDIPDSFQPKPALIESLKKIREILHREGINAHDLQLRVTPDRAYVIDPEFFSPAQGPEVFERFDQHIDFYIEEFEKRLSK